jgi:hypothetical protein
MQWVRLQQGIPKEDVNSIAELVATFETRRLTSFTESGTLTQTLYLIWSKDSFYAFSGVKSDNVSEFQLAFDYGYIQKAVSIDQEALKRQNTTLMAYFLITQTEYWYPNEYDFKQWVAGNKVFDEMIQRSRKLDVVLTFFMEREAEPQYSLREIRRKPIGVQLNKLEQVPSQVTRFNLHLWGE